MVLFHIYLKRTAGFDIFVNKVEFCFNSRMHIYLTTYSAFLNMFISIISIMQYMFGKNKNEVALKPL